MVSRPQEVSTDAEEMLHDPVNRREPLELSGRRGWRKLHRGVDQSGAILVHTLTLQPRNNVFLGAQGLMQPEGHGGPCAMGERGDGG